MPVIKRFGSISIRMYADDRHGPHFHIASPQFEVLVRIEDMMVLAGEVHPARIAEAMQWAKKHRKELERRWAELNERG
jgi:hypothetical protein